MNIGESKLGVRMRDKEPHELKEGEYMLDDDAKSDFRTPGALWLYPAGARHVMLVSGAVHRVTVNQDDTITVSPSIVCRHGDGSSCWHGFLTGGVWGRV